MIRSVRAIVVLIVVTFLFAVSPVLSATAFSSSSAISSSEIQPALVIVDKVNPLVTCSSISLCPAFLDKAYGFDTLHSAGTTGIGQTIVIVDACGSPTIHTDLNTFDSTFGLINPTLNIIDVQGAPACSSSVAFNWSIEISLDVEWAHVVAPSATIDLLIAAKSSFADLLGAWNYSLTYNLGNQISNSWGGSGKCGSSVGSLLATATKDHVTVLASAGDTFAWGQGTTQTEQSPADCKQILTVGGTSLAVSTTGAYVGEKVWNDLCNGGACGTGGGYALTKEPSYQTSVKIPDTFAALGKPDVSADADPATGVLVYNGGLGLWIVVGGTSLSCPLWAGFMADVNQIRASNIFSAAGFVNPFLYKTVYGVSGISSLYAADFHDITPGNNSGGGGGWTAVMQHPDWVHSSGRRLPIRWAPVLVHSP